MAAGPVVHLLVACLAGWLVFWLGDIFWGFPFICLAGGVGVWLIGSCFLFVFPPIAFGWLFFCLFSPIASQVVWVVGWLARVFWFPSHCLAGCLTGCRGDWLTGRRFLSTCFFPQQPRRWYGWFAAGFPPIASQMVWVVRCLSGYSLIGSVAGWLVRWISARRCSFVSAKLYRRPSFAKK